MEDFIDCLGSKLTKGVNRLDISEEKLRDSLLAAISSLPSCDIKNDLVDNFESAFDRLEKYIHKQPTEVAMDLTSVDRLTACLMAIDKDPSHKERNSKLVTCSVTSTPAQLPRILAHWADSIEHAPPNDVINAISAVSRVIPYLPSNQSLFQFILQSVSLLLSKRKALDANNGFKLLPLKQVLFGVIAVGSRQCCHDDLLAGLLSLYIELNSQLEEFPLHHVTSFVLTMLGQSPQSLFNAILQTDVTNKDVISIIAPLIVHVCDHVITCYSALLGSDPLLYLKVYCMVLLLLDTNHFKTIRNLFDSIDVPSNLNEWVWSQSPSVCKQLAIQETWSSWKIKKCLLRKVSEKQLQILLNLLNGEDHPPSPPAKSPGPPTDLFYVDSQKGGDRDNEGCVVNLDDVVNADSEDVGLESMMDLPKISEESADNDEGEDIVQQQQLLCLTPLFVRGGEKKVSIHQHEEDQRREEEERDVSIDGNKRLLTDVDNTLLEDAMPKQKKSKRSKVTATPKMKNKASPKPRLLRSTAKRRGIVLNTMGEIMN